MNIQDYNLNGIPKKTTTPCCWNCKNGMKQLMKKSLKFPSFVVCDNKHSDFYGKEMEPTNGCKLLKKRGVI